MRTLQSIALTALLTSLAACSSQAPQPDVLASVGDAEYAVATGGYVYWAEGTGGPNGVAIERVSETGGAVQLLATNIAAPTGLAVDGTRVYWISGDGSLRAVPLSGVAQGAAPEVIASNLGNPTGVVIAGSDAYVIEASALQLGVSSIVRVPLDGSAQTTLASGAAVASLVSDGTAAYAVQYLIEALPSAGGPISTISRFAAGSDDPTIVLSSRPMVFQIAVADSNLYVAVGESPGTTTADIVRMPLSGGPTITLAAGFGQVVDLTVTPEALYWMGRTSSGSRLWAAPTAGGPAVEVPGESPSDVLADGASLFGFREIAQQTDLTVEEPLGATVASP